MSKAPRFLYYWLPVLLWMGLIFYGSSGQLSMQNTSNFLGPLIHKFFPSLTQEEINQWVYNIRKMSHVTEYAILSLLFWRALRRPIRQDPRPWSWLQCACALMLATGYAITDEIHQALVPTRQGSPWDVLIDCIGAASSLGLLWLLGRWRKYW